MIGSVINCLIACYGHLLYCLIRCKTSALYKSYSLTCRKGQPLSAIKSTEMPVTQNAVHVTIAVSLGENAEKLLFLVYTIRLINILVR